MAQKRMFALQVVDTDRFLDMPTSAQALYFHLGLHGDDDGFVSSPKRVARGVGCNDDDLRLLAAKGYIIPFESGVIVITDWKLNNSLKNDRYHATVYQEEMKTLSVDASDRYVCGTTLEPNLIQDGSNTEPELNITKQSVAKQREGTDKPRRSPAFVPPTVEEVADYCRERSNAVDAQRFVDFYTSKGWLVGKSRMKDWRASVRTWENRDNTNNERSEIPSDEDYLKGANYFG